MLFGPKSGERDQMALSKGGWGGAGGGKENSMTINGK